MSSMYEGFPAIVYAGLWSLRIFGKLKREFPDLRLNMIFFVTDAPPATLIKIDKGDFEIELLEDIKDPEEVENIDCDAYLVLSTDVLVKGIGGIMEGIQNNTVKIKNPDALQFLGRVLGGFL